MLTNKTKHRSFLLTWLAFDALCAVGGVLQWKRVKSYCIRKSLNRAPLPHRPRSTMACTKMTRKQGNIPVVHCQNTQNTNSEKTDIKKTTRNPIEIDNNPWIKMRMKIEI
ncbi:hypothetical protein I3760_08G167600 [Carya illinoinensis]|nr:hypothetical protein I3760_08G167600 [Carya illinoinensis]